MAQKKQNTCTSVPNQVCCVRYIFKAVDFTEITALGSVRIGLRYFLIAPLVGTIPRTSGLKEPRVLFGRKAPCPPIPSQSAAETAAAFATHGAAAFAHGVRYSRAAAGSARRSRFTGGGGSAAAFPLHRRRQTRQRLPAGRPRRAAPRRERKRKAPPPLPRGRLRSDAGNRAAGPLIPPARTAGARRCPSPSRAVRPRAAPAFRRRGTRARSGPATGSPSAGDAPSR